MDDTLLGKTAVVETAHPAKFADAVEKGIGRKPTLPSAAQSIVSREEIYANSIATAVAIQHIVDSHFGS